MPGREHMRSYERTDRRSDALVFFRATGDLAYKQIFPALAALVARGRLQVPVIGVAKVGWDRDQLAKRARESLAEHGLFSINCREERNMEIGAITEPNATTRHASALLFGSTNGYPSGLAVLASVLLNSVAVGLTEQAEHLVAEMTREERGTGPMRPVVVLLPLAGDDHDAAMRVVASAADGSMPVDHRAGPPGAMPSPVTPGPLTEAESRILRYLPTNLSAPEIAAELFCSVNTVKTHIRHVYVKLGAGSRTEAVKRARALGMLASTAARPSGYPAIPHGRRRRVRFAEVQAQ